MSEQLDRIRAAALTWQYKLLRAGLLFVLAIVAGGAAVNMFRSGVPEEVERAGVAFLLTQDDVTRRIGATADWHDERSGVIRSKSGNDAIATLRGELRGPAGRLEANIRLHLENGRWQVWAARYREPGLEWWSVGGPALHGTTPHVRTEPTFADTINAVAAREGAERALAQVDLALRRDYNNADVHLVRAVLLRRMQRYGDAELAFRTVIRLRPSWAEGLTEFAYLQLDRDDRKKAAAMIELALKADPNYGGAHWARAQYVLRTEGDGSNFREARSRACKLGEELACISVRAGR